MDSTLLFDVSTALDALGYHHGDRPFLGKWEERHWMSTPGPIYCAEAGNGSGLLIAPNNVHTDDEGLIEIVYRQPRNLSELHQVVQAAVADTFQGYGMDGNQHWSSERLKEWWAGPRRMIEQEVRRRYELQCAQGLYAPWIGLHQWLDYLQKGLYKYLQVYAFFLDTGRLPLINERLPNW
jgi:hypothetical protein